MTTLPLTLPMTMPAAWRRSLPPLLLLLAAVLLVYRETGAAMVLIWTRSDTFAHAFLVLPISLWLFWRQRQALAQQVPQPAAWVLPAFAAAALVWLLGELVAVNSVTQLALVAMVVLAVPAVLGVRVAWVVLFPLLFLFFSAPVGEFLLPTLIGWTADFTVMALRLSGIPVLREGNQFQIPTGNWSVVDACSGVRYLIASFMVGTLFAYLNYRSTRRRLIFAVVSILVPVLANWLRAYMIVMLGHLSGNTIAVGADHLIYGWVFFGIVITALFMIGARWAEPDAPAAAPAARLASPGASAGSHHDPKAGAASWLIVLATVLLVAAPPAALWLIERGERADQPRLALPALLAPPWQALEPGLALDWQPAFNGPSAQAQRSYHNGAQAVGLYLAYYRRQSDNHKLVSSLNVLVGAKDKAWNQIATGTRAVALPGFDAPLTLRTGQLLRAEQPGVAERPRVLAWQLYWVNGRWTSSDYVAKLTGAWQRLQGQGDESASVVVYMIASETANADATLDAFVRANLAALDALLVAARDGH